MEFGLFRAIYRSDNAQLAGGKGNSEMLIPLEQLERARELALNLPGRIHTIQPTGGDPSTGGEALALYKGAVIVIPTVGIAGNALDTYLQQGWPGLNIQSEEYTALERVAKELGNLPIPQEDVKYIRNPPLPRPRRIHSLNPKFRIDI